MMATPQLTPDRAREILSRFPQASILIVGDVMLDHFVVGRVNRISPEAPVPVVEHDRDEYRAGGAAGAAERLRHELEAKGIGIAGLTADPARPTTTKLRVVTNRNQQVARIDYESDMEIDGPIQDMIRKRVEQCVGSAGAVLVSDYLKGTVTRALVGDIVSAARARRIP